MDPDSVTRLTQYLAHLLTFSGLDLEYTLEVQPPAEPAHVSMLPGEVVRRASAGAPAAPIAVAFSGPDVPLLNDRNAELLHAIESVAAAVLRLEPTEHHLLQFDAGGLRAARARWLESSAQEASTSVRSTGRPFMFPPMNSRERRLLHLAVAPSGLRSESLGDGPRRSVVVYPPGQTAQSTGLSRAASRSAKPGKPFQRGVRPSPPQERYPQPDVEDLSEPAPSPPSASEADRIRAIRERFRSR